MRHLIGLLLALALAEPRVAAATDTEPPHAIVLQYHHVADDTQSSTSVSPQNFQRQMRFLTTNHYVVLPLPELLQRLRNGQTLPERTVAITFEEANRSVCETVFPLLTKLSIPFTVFVNTNPIDNNYPANCSWDQLREMGRAGVTLANHTASYRHLVYRAGNQSFKDWRAMVLEEIEHGEQRLLAETGQSHHLLAWPYGEANEATKEIARSAGYTAFGQQSGPLGKHSDWLELPRFAMWGRIGSDAAIKQLATILETLPFPIAYVNKPDNPLASDSPIPTLEVVLLDSQALDARLTRRRQLTCYDSTGRRISATWLSSTRFRAKAIRALPSGRSRYNCSLPAGNGRLYWYSSTWIKTNDKGAWPD